MASPFSPASAPATSSAIFSTSTSRPCPEFRKGGSYRKGDACEYAHGMFECWLHPAQYRTHLCKDEVGCSRRICFFTHKGHKPEELRAVNPSAVSVGVQPVSSPRSSPPNKLDMAMLNPSWPSSPASRLKMALGARELDFDLELLALDQYQQKLFNKVSNAPSPRASWCGASGLGSPLTTTAPARTVSDYTNLLGSVDPAMLSQLHTLSLKQAGDVPAYSSLPNTQLHMPTSPMVGANTTALGLDHSMAMMPWGSEVARWIQPVDSTHGFNPFQALVTKPNPP